jgi:RNA polymerase sigma-70 factor (ECF subfamily)
VSASLAKIDEGQLVERSQAGDRRAFEELVRRHADRLYAVVLRFSADADEAEEVTQEAFLRAWRSIERFELRSRFFTWLYRIGINEAKRRAERRPPGGTVSSIEDSPIEEAPDWSEAPELRAEQGHLRRVLEDAVRALPLEIPGAADPARRGRPLDGGGLRGDGARRGRPQEPPPPGAPCRAQGR